MNETNSNKNINNNTQQQPHRARLIQIPNKLEETLLYNRSFDSNNNNNNNNNSSSINSSNHINNSSNMPILSTSQLKFPRKPLLRSSSPPNSPPPPPPLPGGGIAIPISRSFVGTNSIPTTYIQSSPSRTEINSNNNSNNSSSHI